MELVLSSLTLEVKKVVLVYGQSAAKVLQSFKMIWIRGCSMTETCCKYLLLKLFCKKKKQSDIFTAVEKALHGKPDKLAKCETYVNSGGASEII